MSYRVVADVAGQESSLSRGQLKQLFDVFDIERSGYIDVRELKAALRALGCVLTGEQIRDALRVAGQFDLKTPVSFETFCAVVEPKLPGRDSVEAYTQLFLLLGPKSDVAGSGVSHSYITISNLRQICEELNESVPENELQLMIQEADQDSDGRVTLNDFVRMMQNLNDPLY